MLENQLVKYLYVIRKRFPCFQIGYFFGDRRFDYVWPAGTTEEEKKAIDQYIGEIFSMDDDEMTRIYAGIKKQEKLTSNPLGISGHIRAIYLTDQGFDYWLTRDTITIREAIYLCVGVDPIRAEEKLNRLMRGQIFSDKHEEIRNKLSKGLSDGTIKESVSIGTASVNSKDLIDWAIGSNLLSEPLENKFRRYL